MADPTRRQVLRRYGTVLGGSAVAGLAGCSGEGDDDGDTTEPGDGAANVSGPSYSRWLVAPEQFGRIEQYVFRSHRPSRLRSLETAMGAVDLEQFSGSLAAGVQWTDVEAFHRVPGGAVVTGDLSFGEWQSSLSESGFSESESYRGYTLYTSESGGAIGFGDGVAIVNQSRANSTQTVQTLVDTRRGAISNAPATDDAIGALVETLGDGTVVTGSDVTESTFGNAVVAGQRFAIGDRESEYRVAFVYDSEDDVETETLRERIVGTELFDGPDAVTVEQRGRVAVATGILPTSELSTLNPNLRETERPSVPTASFAFDYDADAGTLTITHQSGDTVEQPTLYIRGAGFTNVDGVDMTGPGRWAGERSSQDGTGVSAGDSVTVGVESDYDVSVVWQSADGSSSATLGDDEGPDA